MEIETYFQRISSISVSRNLIDGPSTTGVGFCRVFSAVERMRFQYIPQVAHRIRTNVPASHHHSSGSHQSFSSLTTIRGYTLSSSAAENDYCQ